MLQWMGGSRRKVTTSRKSTQKRQKQYFEQRKRQQQNLQIMGSESSSEVLGISGQYLNEHRSLDILNLLNLSTNAQECYSPCVKETADAEANISTMPGKILKNQPTVFTSMATPVESSRIEEARVPPACQMDALQKKDLVSADYQNGALSGIHCTSTNSKTVTDQYVGLSVIDLLYDDGPKSTVEEHPAFEDHVAFSLEGLGKVGAETPPHSPQQPNRISYSYSQLLKDEKKKKWSKAINHELEDLELEVDTMMQDINAAPMSNFSNLPYKRGKRRLAASQDYNHFNDQANKNGSSISQEFFHNSEIKDDDIWNAPSSSIFDEKFDDEREYDTSWEKKTFQRGTNYPYSLKSGVCKARYAFEDHLPKKRSLAEAFDRFDTIEFPAPYSKYRPENDYDFFVASGARCSRSDGNFLVQSLVPEDVRDNSSLLSEESCSSTAVRVEAITHSPSRLSTGETSKEQMYAFGSLGNKRRSNEGKCRSSMSTSSKQKPCHSNSIIEEDICAHSSWHSGERYSPVNINSGESTFCQNSEAKFAALGSNNGIGNEDPFGNFTIPEPHDKASPSFNGLKSSARVVDSPPCCFTSEKFAFGKSHVFSDVQSWSTGPNFPAKFASIHCETSSPDLHENAGRHEDMKLEMQQDCQGNSEIKEETFLGKNKCGGDTSTSNNHTQDCEVEKDPNLLITHNLETTNSLGHVEEISSSLIKKPDKIETKVDNTKNNCDAETPLKCKIANEDMENWWQTQERSMVARKNKKEPNNFSGQVTFEGYVFHLLCVQKALKGGSLASI